MNPDTVVGERFGLAFPVTLGPLRALGADFLTRAFHAGGSLHPDNRVTAITRFDEFFGGGMGRKAQLTVAYERADAGLHTELFVKFPRDFGDPLRDLFAPLMAPEVHFALLSRRSDFPIAVPTCYFADFDPATQSGILITERVRYGEGGIEPCHEKCADFALQDPLAHYEALTRTMARLAGRHRSGLFGPAVDAQFAFEPDRIDPGSRIPYTPEQLRHKLDKLLSFAEQAPQLFPAPLLADGFLQRFASEAPQVLEQELALRACLNHQSDCIALCHWNMNLDNAWFWTDPHGELQAGLLDWGSVGQMNVAQAFYGMTCAAEAPFLNEHRDRLLRLFVDEYARQGGPALSVDRMTALYRFAVALLGIAWILDAPSLVEAQLGDVTGLTGRHDARLQGDFLARAQLQLLMVMLNEWRALDIGATLARFAAGERP